MIALSPMTILKITKELYGHYLAHMGEVELEPGDAEEALRAAASIGDDRLQKQARGYVMPDKFTHGTSKQRVKWFKLGFDTGDIKKGDALFTLPYEDL